MVERTRLIYLHRFIAIEEIISAGSVPAGATCYIHAESRFNWSPPRIDHPNRSFPILVLTILASVRFSSRSCRYAVAK